MSPSDSGILSRRSRRGLSALTRPAEAVDLLLPSPYFRRKAILDRARPPCCWCRDCQ